jgi:hypothetical protein
VKLRTSAILAIAWAQLYAALSQPKGDRLELSSSTAEIRDICEKRSEATAKLGYAAATEFARVLADIEASDNFADFEAMFGGQIFDESETEKRFHMKTGAISFRSGHPHNLGTQATATNWPRTTRLMITAIEATDA